MEDERAPTIEYLEELADTDPRAAIDLANRRGNGLDTLAIAGVLIDAGTLTGDAKAIRRGISLAQRLRRQAHEDEAPRDVAPYYEGNGFQSLANITQAPPAPDDYPLRATWFETTRKDRLRARRAFAESGEIGDTTAGQQAWINLGNDLHLAGRYIEAYDCFVRALPHPVAAGWATEALNHSAEFNPTIASSLRRKSSELALVAQAGASVVAEVVGEATVEHFASLSTSAEPPTDLESAERSDYERFVEEHRLHLSIAADGVDPANWDHLPLPSYSVSIDEAKARSPELLAMFNVCKSDLLLARRLVFDGVDDADFADAALYGDTLDYARYGQQVSRLTLGLRSALDVLDKVGTAFNHHFRVGLEPKRVSFGSIWRDVDNGNELRPVVRDEIRAGNLSVLALVELSADLYEDGWLSGRRELRNIATHRFVVAHDTMSSPISSSPATTHIRMERLGQSAISAVRLGRSALCYLAEAISRYEDRNRLRATPALPLVFPSHSYIRQGRS